MLLENFSPGPALQEYVRNFGIVHFVFSGKEVIPAKTYSPRPGDSMEFFLREPEYVLYPEEHGKVKRPSAVIMGQHTVVTNRFVGNEFLYLNITFQPGILYRLTGIPSYELVNSYIDAESVFSSEIRLITERLKNAGSYAEMISLAESYVLTLVSQTKKQAHGIDKVAKMLQQNTGPSQWIGLPKKLAYVQNNLKGSSKKEWA